ncbi:MAG TPA: carboxylesterase family protein [Polyangiaceae bacterium]|nr:carboxylesterase family protein [Polyangiaceae bacterium]
MLHRSWLSGCALALLLAACGSSESDEGRANDAVDALDATAAASDPLVVTTADGPLRGVASGALEQFLGVPYAAPPLGDLRWAAPAPHEAWTDVRDASTPGAVCSQLTLAGVVGSEDCLSVNVYRPARRDPSVRLPVMVWIHGGSFVSGAGSIYDPRRLVESGEVIVVTINYRLGMLGFLAHPALSAESSQASGDYGLLDQQAALRWVRDNIAAFGGDPAQVTIDGQSAGGASVCAQLASPGAAGLFSRAVIQSASCASAPLALAEAQGSSIASALGCGDASSSAACLRALPAEQLTGGQATALFGPIVGGDVLPEAPAAVVAAGEQHAVPVLLGGVSDEMRGFFALEYPLDPARYPTALATYFPNLPGEAIAAEYPLADYPEPFLALSAALSDSGAYLAGSLGGCVTSDLADLFSISTPTYVYDLDDPAFTWAKGAIPIPVPRGASHSSDIAFLFETSIVLSEPFTPPQTALAEQMVAAWGAFIRSGNPNFEGTTVWPRYDVPARSTLHLEPDAAGVITDFRDRRRCAFWQQLRANVAQPAAP